MCVQVPLFLYERGDIVTCPVEAGDGENTGVKIMFEKTSNSMERLLWETQESVDKQVEGSIPQWGLRQNYLLGELNKKK